MRCINADELLSWFDNHYDDEIVTVGYVSGLIKDSPTVEPERKTGKWIDQDEGAFYPIECSECHKVPLLDAYGDCVCSDFCPHCGAKMDGGGQECKRQSSTATE